MPFIPHTAEDISSMLSVIGAGSIDELFDEVPPALRTVSLAAVPPAMSESAVGRLMHQRAGADGGGICFLGGGAYDHHIPAAVWEVAARGEFYSAYTPYQAEASQGTLQVLYEYQTMMAHLTAMDVSNASLYDGASALAEAVLMAVRLARRNRARRILVPTTVHPAYRSVVRTLVHNQGIEVVELAYDETAGHLAPALLETIDGEDFAALVIPQPNYFGVLEEVHALTDWAHDQGLLVIAVVNPLLLSVLAPPGEWGATGADIVCGDGQPLGAPLSSGGPYFGFLTCKQAFVRQMPGRLVGRTVDQTGAPGFTLTLQAREQHIRRSKATSNICTNQGLMVTAATLHMAIMGAEGLRRTAAACHANCVGLAERLTAIEGVERVFHGDFGYELVLRLPVPARDVSRSLAAHNLLAGVVLEADYPELADCLLVCATEKRTAEDIESYGELLGRIIEHRLAAKCPVQPRL